MHWAQRLGELRHARDGGRRPDGASEEEHAAQASAVSLDRWQQIVACLRRFADGYNSAAKRAVLSVVEQPGEPAVTIATGREGMAYFTAVLEGTLICTHGRGSGGVTYATEVRLTPVRNDNATAAYLVQNWMQHL
jgi:hypothetical protein